MCWRSSRPEPTGKWPDRKSPPTAATGEAPSDVRPDGDPAQQKLVVFAEKSEEARLGCDPVGHQREFASQDFVELVARAAHVPVACDQPDRMELVLRQPPAGLFGIGARVDRFAAKIDAALNELAAAAEPAGDVGF